MKSSHVTNAVKVFLRVGISMLVATLLVAPLFTGIAYAKEAPGAVYVMTNAVGGNEVLIFDRAANGALISAGSVATGGSGSGAGLGSQGALILSNNNHWLFAVNAGSDEVSVFAVKAGTLVLTDNIASGGQMPISLTFDKGVLYVLNAGGSGNITGFTLSGKGKLSPLSGSTQPLSNSGAGPAQISFTPNGKQLVVTEKATNQILTYRVGKFGRAGAPTVHASAGTTPFGFDFGKDESLIVSEAFGGMTNAGAVSSYQLDKNGFSVVSASSPSHQTAPCWVVTTDNGKYAYTTNAGSGSISGYRVGKDGQLSLLNANGQTGLTGDGSHPIDEAVSNNSHYLYVLASGTPAAPIPAVVAFQIGSDGSLTPAGNLSILTGTAGIAGIAAR